MVLVTGGTGFIGAYIIQELVRMGHKVRAIRRSNHQPFFVDAEILSRIEWVTCDVLDITGLEEAVKGVDAIIHSAAVVSFQSRDQRQMYSTNIEGTANVVNVAIDNNIRRFIHISSVAALGRKNDGSVVNEARKWEESKTNTHYAVSKYHAEMEVWRGFGEGLNGVIVCPTTVLGYGDWNNSSCAIFKNVYNEFPWYTKGVNGFVDVEDVARATVALLDSNISNQRFILNGDNWSFEQLLNTMADGFNKKRPSRHATKFLGGLAWRIEKIKSLLFNKRALLTKESARVAQSKTLFDNSRILKALPGFSFTPLEQSINTACKKYAAQL